MNRREWLQKAAIIAAGVVAADQLELLDRLAPRRLYFRGADFKIKTYALGFRVTQEMVDDDSMYATSVTHGRVSSRKYVTATEIRKSQEAWKERFEREITRFHRQRIDNLLLSNLRM